MPFLVVPGPSVDGQLRPSLATVPSCYGGFGGIDNPDRSLDRFRDHLRGGVSAAGHELPSDEGDQFTG